MMRDEQQIIDQNKEESKLSPKMVTVRNRLKSSIITYGETIHKEEDEAKALVASFMGITLKQLTWWCNNESQPTVEQAFNLAKFIGKSLNDIFYQSI